MPPPTHIVMTTYFSPRRLPSINACMTMRAPLMPFTTSPKPGPRDLAPCPNQRDESVQDKHGTKLSNLPILAPPHSGILKTAATNAAS